MTVKVNSPVSFPVHARRLPEKGLPVVIAPDAKARAALATDHDLVDVESFRADLLVRSWKRDGVQVSGTVDAVIVQRCIVTLEPIRATIHQEVEGTFVPPGSELARPQTTEGELFLSAEGPDLPEEFEGDTLDVGALAEEFFALAIDPYPRKQGAELSREFGRKEGDSPFAALSRLAPKA